MTREVPLSRGLVALVDDEDYARVAAAGPWHVNPGRRTIYAQRNTRRADGGKTTQSMHRFIADVAAVDHVNGNGLDNRRANLRAATSAQNAANRPRRVDSKSPFKGVLINNDRGRPWRAQIHHDGRKRHLGCFDTAEEAARAYDVAALGAWGEFARLNFPLETAS